jgi:membrane carboxypeptidase/penicillin-binding protein
VELAAVAGFDSAHTSECREADGAGVALPRFQPFLDGEAREKQGRDRVSPSPREEAVEQQTDEKGGGGCDSAGTLAMYASMTL